MKIAHAAQLASDPAFIHFAAKCRKLFGGSVTSAQGFENRLRSEHTALDGHVNALEPLRIQQARGIADDQTSGKISTGDGIPATDRNRFGAIPNEFAAFENPADKRMSLEM